MTHPARTGRRVCATAGSLRTRGGHIRSRWLSLLVSLKFPSRLEFRGGVTANAKRIGHRRLRKLKPPSPLDCQFDVGPSIPPSIEGVRAVEGGRRWDDYRGGCSRRDRAPGAMASSRAPRSPAAIAARRDGIGVLRFWVAMTISLCKVAVVRAARGVPDLLSPDISDVIVISWPCPSMITRRHEKSAPPRRERSSEHASVRRPLKALDDWRRGQSDIPSRPEAIRRLFERALSR